MKKMIINDAKKIVSVNFDDDFGIRISVRRFRDNTEILKTDTQEFSFKIQGDGKITRRYWPEKKNPVDFTDEVYSGDTINVYSDGTMEIIPSFFSKRRRERKERNEARRQARENRKYRIEC